MGVNAGDRNPTSKMAELFDGIGGDYGETYQDSPLHVEMVQKFASMLTPGSKVLDIGCGTGVPNSQILVKHGMHIHGFDPSSAMLKESRKNVPQGTFELAEVETFLPTEKYDGIMCTLVLMQTPHSVSMATRIASWLKPGGLLLLGTVDYNNFPRAHDDDIDISGETFYYTFMGNVIKDNTCQVGDWIRLFREAGVVLVCAEQETYTPSSREIEPEPQFFYIGRKSTKDALLGPYKHPYIHYPPVPVDSLNSWEALVQRRGFASESIWGTSNTAIIGRNDNVSACIISGDFLYLDWALDNKKDPGQYCLDILSHCPNLKVISILQACPGNDLLRIVNEVALLFGKPLQHHGAMLHQLITAIQTQLSGCTVETKLVPAWIDGSDMPLEQRSEEFARLIENIWFADSVPEDDLSSEVEESVLNCRLKRYFSNIGRMRKIDEAKIGFDCVEVTIRRS